MERFVAQLTNQRFKLKLDDILYQSRPFQHFKHAIDNSEFRQQWFDFKQSELEKIVEKKLSN